MVVSTTVDTFYKCEQVLQSSNLIKARRNALSKTRTNGGRNVRSLEIHELVFHQPRFGREVTRHVLYL
jgi:hypothetical protein